MRATMRAASRSSRSGCSLPSLRHAGTRVSPRCPPQRPAQQHRRRCRGTDSVPPAARGAGGPPPASEPARSAAPAAAEVAASREWSEHAAWEAAIKVIAGDDGVATAALLRGVQGLNLLLPDLEPHWREQLEVHQSLAAIERMLRGTAPPASSSPPPASSSSSSSSSWDICLYSEAQRAAGEMQRLTPFFRQHGTRATESCYQQCNWVLTEALMGAARNYSGPGSTLLRAADLQGAAVAVQALRRAHEAHLSGLVRLQLRLGMALPAVSVRLVELRAACAQQGVDVGHLAATNLSVLLPPTAQAEHRG